MVVKRVGWTAERETKQPFHATAKARLNAIGRNASVLAEMARSYYLSKYTLITDAPQSDLTDSNTAMLYYNYNKKICILIDFLIGSFFYYDYYIILIFGGFLHG